MSRRSAAAAAAAAAAMDVDMSETERALAAAQAATPPSAQEIMQSVTALSTSVVTPVAAVSEDEKWARSLLHKSDFFNNYGAAFVDLPFGSNAIGNILREMETPMGAQSGPGLDERETVANRLWLSIHESCNRIFEGYRPVSVAMHASDLLTHIASADGVCRMQRDDRYNWGAPVQRAPMQRDQVSVVSFQWSYLSMGFVAQTASMRRGLFLPVFVVDADPSYLIDTVLTVAKSREILEQENMALYQIREYVRLGKTEEEKTEDDKREDKIAADQHKRANTVARVPSRIPVRIVVIEPLMVPGGGRLFRPQFVLAVQDLCTELGLSLVADETLSSVRSGHNLYSLSIPRFKPDWVMLGKPIGAALLLASKSKKGSAAAEHVMNESFTVVAPAMTLVQMAATLRIFADRDIAAFCRKNGERLKVAFKEGVTNPATVRGIGHCLWVDSSAEELPIKLTINGRILARVDQTAADVRWVCKQEDGNMKRLRDAGLLNKYRLPNCAICGDKLHHERKTARCTQCIRAYHAEPLGPQCTGITMTRGKGTCQCGAVTQSFQVPEQETVKWTYAQDAALEPDSEMVEQSQREIQQGARTSQIAQAAHASQAAQAARATPVDDATRIAQAAEVRGSRSLASILDDNTTDQEFEQRMFNIQATAVSSSTSSVIQLERIRAAYSAEIHDIEKDISVLHRAIRAGDNSVPTHAKYAILTRRRDYIHDKLVAVRSAIA